MLDIRVDDFFFIILWVGWGGSAFLLLASYLRYKIFTFLDAGVVMSWFFIFFRPVNIYSCQIQLDLYYWDELLYVNGAVISIIFLLAFQLASLLVPKRKLSLGGSFDLMAFRKRMESGAFVVFLCCCFVVLVMFFKFGYQVFPSNRGGGALSVSMPGLEIFYHIIRALTLVLIILSVVLLLMFRSVKGVFYSVVSVSVLLIFAKRNAIIYPFFYSVVLYSYYVVYRLNKGLLRVFLVISPLVVFLVFIAFFGKSFKSQEGVNFEPPPDGYACYAVRLGMQEFDLFWPAVLEVSDGTANAVDLPFAIWGALTHDHANRVSSPYLSITDKTMLEYNYDNYVYKKFGISPSIAQFYYYYFWWWGLVVVVVVAVAVRWLDFLMIKSFYLGRFGLFMSAISISKLLLSPFDFTIKYSVFEMVVFLGLYCVMVLYFSSLAAFSRLWRLNGVHG